jgi:hypothetical protein
MESLALLDLNKREDDKTSEGKFGTGFTFRRIVIRKSLPNRSYFYSYDSAFFDPNILSSINRCRQGQTGNVIVDCKFATHCRNGVTDSVRSDGTGKRHKKAILPETVTSRSSLEHPWADMSNLAGWPTETWRMGSPSMRTIPPPPPSRSAAAAPAESMLSKKKNSPAKQTNEEMC